MTMSKLSTGLLREVWRHEGLRGAMDRPRGIVVGFLEAVGLDYLVEITPRC